MGTVPLCAFQLLKSASVTPRAREQAPQENTGILLSTIFAMVSLRGSPSDGFDCINRRLAHEVGGVVSEKYLHVMPGVGQCKPVGKGEGCSSRLIGSPRTPHQDVQFLLGCLRLLSLRLTVGSGNGRGCECAGSQLRRFFKKVPAGCHTPPSNWQEVYTSGKLITIWVCINTLTRERVPLAARTR